MIHDVYVVAHLAPLSIGQSVWLAMVSRPLTKMDHFRRVGVGSVANL